MKFSLSIWTKPGTTGPRIYFNGARGLGKDDKAFAREGSDGGFEIHCWFKGGPVETWDQLLRLAQSENEPEAA